MISRFIGKKLWHLHSSSKIEMQQIKNVFSLSPHTVIFTAVENNKFQTKIYDICNVYSKLSFCVHVRTASSRLF